MTEGVSLKTPGETVVLPKAPLVADDAPSLDPARDLATDPAPDPATDPVQPPVPSTLGKDQSVIKESPKAVQFDMKPVVLGQVSSVQPATPKVSTGTVTLAAGKLESPDVDAVRFSDIKPLAALPLKAVRFTSPRTTSSLLGGAYNRSTLSLWTTTKGNSGITGMFGEMGHLTLTKPNLMGAFRPALGLSHFQTWQPTNTYSWQDFKLADATAFSMQTKLFNKYVSLQNNPAASQMDDWFANPMAPGAKAFGAFGSALGMVAATAPKITTNDAKDLEKFGQKVEMAVETFASAFPANSVGAKAFDALQNALNDIKTTKDPTPAQSRTLRFNIQETLDAFERILSDKKVEDSPDMKRVAKTQFDAVLLAMDSKDRVRTDGKLRSYFLDREPLPPAVEQILLTYAGTAGKKLTISELQQKLGMKEAENEGKFGSRTLYYLQLQTIKNLQNTLPELNEEASKNITNAVTTIEDLTKTVTDIQSGALKQAKTEKLLASRHIAVVDGVLTYTAKSGQGARALTESEAETVKADCIQELKTQFAGTITTTSVQSSFTTGVSAGDLLLQKGIAGFNEAIARFPHAMTEALTKGAPTKPVSAVTGAFTVMIACHHMGSTYDEQTTLIGAMVQDHGGISADLLTAENINLFKASFGDHFKIIDRKDGAGPMADIDMTQDELQSFMKVMATMKEESPLGAALRTSMAQVSAVIKQDGVLSKLLAASVPEGRTLDKIFAELETRLETQAANQAKLAAIDAKAHLAIDKINSTVTVVDAPPPATISLTSEQDRQYHLSTQHNVPTAANDLIKAKLSAIIRDQETDRADETAQVRLSRRNRELQDETRQEAKAFSDTLRAKGDEAIWAQRARHRGTDVGDRR
ncbi:MAG: hypothetical protein H7338_21685 [Candidatus Sericytochromatia bacterium]|nr:hypothetical protein [Candidatus Sericytochromatia bacterium]